MRRKGASEEELKTQREKDSQSVKDSRKRAKKEQAQGYPVRQPLNQRALAAGTSSSRGLFTGPNYEEGVDRLLTQNAFSKMVCRAEQSTAEKEKSNKERRAHDNHQLALDEMKRDGNDEIVVNYLKAAARDGHALAMGQLGCAYNGDVYMWRLGGAYVHGKLELGVDKELAFFWLQKAAEGGLVDAQYFLASAYQNGDVLGLDVNEKLELFWLQKAAEGGENSAQFLLGCAYEDGDIGLDVDKELALLWLQKAAEGGHEKAQCELSEAYHLGKFGLDVDQEKAFGYVQEAAKGGSSKAQDIVKSIEPMGFVCCGSACSIHAAVCGCCVFEH
jgi:TPR repeat protein